MRKMIIGVMGPGDQARKKDIQNAFELGRQIAQEGWVVLSGGFNVGVMDAVSRGAKEAGGLTVGILPTGDHHGMSPAVDIPILTGMGSARNNINVLTSDLVIACGMSAGTASEVALALKANKPVILLTDDEEGQRFFKKLSSGKVLLAKDLAEAIEKAKQILSHFKE